MFYQLFLSPQVKRWAIITYKHGIYELPHELANHLRLTILKQIFSLEKNMEACAPCTPISPPPPPANPPPNTNDGDPQQKQRTTYNG